MTSLPILEAEYEGSADQLASLEALIIAEPDASDALFSGLRIERRNKHTIIDGEWGERPWLVTTIDGKPVSDMPETMEFAS